MRSHQLDAAGRWLPGLRAAVNAPADHKVVVTCPRTGPETAPHGVDQPPPRTVTLADLRAFVAELERWGAPGDTVIPADLSATVRLGDRAPGGKGGTGEGTG